MSEYWQMVLLITMTLVCVGGIFAFTSAVVYAFPERERWGWPVAILSPLAVIFSSAWLLSYGGL